MHTEFSQFFPQIAKHETRSITIVDDNNSNGLPKGQYAFLELYCTDKNCDCRNVYIHVYNHNGTALEATISYGWEPLKFYIDWMGGDKKDAKMLKDLKGPALAVMAPQSPRAEKWLAIFKEMIKTDKNYANRLKGHYELIKGVVNQK